ncbi:MAG TPA: hypothetical protein DIW81_11480 [Planctomycetaceae bacterium]|uniref:hypothetical protein n=2 Tax=Rubinisphaera TaxID=1649490 RepID=UPI000C10101E|nr:hypothetical protein [Rubinisphaera sp.]MBV08843.1 hypothetical protein [Rubinisphaera sp.]HCS52197.1 hypothetical protein [Planctomycetaceae bacterium]|tara:strand:+ start:8653 stop:9699 length:1047 start_codon:yes stop_codon:yes gene_type:complete
MPITAEIIQGAVDRYWREFDRYAKLSEFVGEACRQLLEQDVIRGSVQWRAKNPERLRGKLEKWMKADEHQEINSVDDVFIVLKDLAGSRITTYIESERVKVVSSLGKRFDGLGGAEVTPDVKDVPGSFYRATHCIVTLKAEDLIGRYENLRGLGCEIQVCSLLAHVYNEIEHDLRYKPLSGELSKQETGLLDGLGHLVACGDIVINQTLNAVAERQRENTDQFEDEYDFVTRMRTLFPSASNFASNAGQLYEVCTKLDLDSPEKIKTAIQYDENSTPEVARQEAISLAPQVAADGGQLEIEVESSDQLLILLLKDHELVTKLKGLFPSGRGVGRAPRFLSIAKRMDEG